MFVFNDIRHVFMLSIIPDHLLALSVSVTSTSVRSQTQSQQYLMGVRFLPSSSAVAVM